MNIKVTEKQQDMYCMECDMLVTVGFLVWDGPHIVQPLSCRKCTEQFVRNIKEKHDVELG